MLSLHTKPRRRSFATTDSTRLRPEIISDLFTWFLFMPKVRVGTTERLPDKTAAYMGNSLTIQWSRLCISTVGGVGWIAFSVLHPNTSHACLPSARFHCKLLFTQCYSVLIRTCVSLSFIWGRGLMMIYIPLIGFPPNCYMSFIILQELQENRKRTITSFLFFMTLFFKNHCYI